MKNIFSGTYEQVVESISESFAKECINTGKSFGTFKCIGYIVFFNACVYGVYGGSIYMGNHMAEAEMELDLSNEYIPFFSNIWYVHIVALFFVMAAMTARYLHGKNNVKGFFVYNILQAFGAISFFILLFKLGQLFVLSFTVRVIYAIIFIAVTVFVLVKGYQNAVKMVYGANKKRHPLIEWMSRQARVLSAILVPIGGIVYFIKTTFETAGKLETRIVGSLVGFMPLIFSAFMLIYLYISSVFIRSYYLNKYSEEFRQKFGVEKEVWYGLKPFQKNKEEDAKAEEIT